MHVPVVVNRRTEVLAEPVFDRVEDASDCDKRLGHGEVGRICHALRVPVHATARIASGENHPAQSASARGSRHHDFSTPGTPGQYTRAR